MNLMDKHHASLVYRIRISTKYRCNQKVSLASFIFVILEVFLFVCISFFLHNLAYNTICTVVQCYYYVMTHRQICEKRSVQGLYGLLETFNFLTTLWVRGTKSCTVVQCIVVQCTVVQCKTMYIVQQCTTMYSCTLYSCTM